MNAQSVTVYVALLNEGVDVWRPVEAEPTPAGYRLLQTPDCDPDDEAWEFPPGSFVRCEVRRLSSGPALVAAELIDP